MFKKIGLGLGLGAALYVGAGFKIREAFDYVRVFAQRAANAVRESIPADVEIDRLALMLERVDAELASETRAQAVAEAQLGQANVQLAASQQRRNGEVARLAATRRELRQSSPGFPGAHADAEQRFASGVRTCSAFAATVEQREAGLARQAQALTQARQHIAALRLQRQALGQQLAELQARSTAQRLAAARPADAPAALTTVRDAEQLAERLAARLEIDEEVTGRLAAPAPAIRAAGPSFSDAAASLEALQRRINPVQTAAR